MGLSPRVRGNHVCNRLAQRGERSIPACTGEPVAGVALHAKEAVYPRVYGGTWVTFEQALALDGLSPRVRGNRVGSLKEPMLPRSIPACTGEPLELL